MALVSNLYFVVLVLPGQGELIDWDDDKPHILRRADYPQWCIVRAESPGLAATRAAEIMDLPVRGSASVFLLGTPETVPV
jgi:hypothetical protein